MGTRSDTKNQLIYHEIGQDEVILIGPVEGLLSRIKELAAADLTKHRLIAPGNPAQKYPNHGGEQAPGAGASAGSAPSGRHDGKY